MDASGRDLSEAYLRGFFAPGEVREVLGMRLVNDPERGMRTFPEHRARTRPRVFVEDPGPLAESMGLKDLTKGDALWTFSDDIARFRLMHIDSIATFVAGAAQRHHPRASTGLCFVYGSTRGDGAEIGWTGCRSIQVPGAEIERLGALAQSLRAHAAGHGIPLERSREHYGRGPYWLHVLRRRFGRRTFEKDGITHNVLADHPVHEQFFSMLLHAFSRIAPCEVEVAGEGRRLTFSPGGTSDEAPAREIKDAMAPYQLGSARWLFRKLRKMSHRGKCSIRLSARSGGEMLLDIKPLGRERAVFRSSFTRGEAPSPAAPRH